MSNGNDEKVLLIPKIENGIVIDHIPAGLGVRVLEVLRAWPGLSGEILTLGCNLQSTRMGCKDMIKLWMPDLPTRLVEHICLVSPGATVKRIEGYHVAHRYVAVSPAEIRGLARCRNPACVTNHERDACTRFVATDETHRRFRCVFCERVFALEDLELVLT
ncbi:MAG: aspartate carbamoyltransferase regulatory subunit [Deltaproteobacteria bacterium]|nr:aspartate carbamoyltransferase regulatory subunit [Deltaproteobacteria bacterium]